MKKHPLEVDVLLLEASDKSLADLWGGVKKAASTPTHDVAKTVQKAGSGDFLGFVLKTARGILNMNETALDAEAQKASLKHLMTTLPPKELIKVLSAHKDAIMKTPFIQKRIALQNNELFTQYQKDKGLEDIRNRVTSPKEVKALKALTEPEQLTILNTFVVGAFIAKNPTIKEMNALLFKQLAAIVKPELVKKGLVAAEAPAAKAA